MNAPRACLSALPICTALLALAVACDRAGPDAPPAPPPAPTAEAGAAQPSSGADAAAGGSGEGRKGDAAAYYPGSRDKPQ